MNNKKRICFTKHLAIALSALLIISHPGASQASAGEDSMMMSAAKSIAEGALGKIGGEAAGWVMGLLGIGDNGGQDQKIINELNSIEGQLTNIETTLQQIEQGTINNYKQEVENEAQGLINNLSTAVGAIEPHWTTYSLILSNKSATPAQMSDLTKAVISDVPAQLDAIDLLLTAPSASGSAGLIEVYANVISNKSFPDNSTPIVGDTSYYQQLHEVVAYYNLWRLRAVTMLVDAYHYQALQESNGSTASNVCSQSASKLSCQLAAHYANRFYNPSSANDNAGIIAQLQIAGDSVTNTYTVPFIAPVTTSGPFHVNTSLWSKSLFKMEPPPEFPGAGGGPMWMPPQVSSWSAVPDATQKGSPEHVFFGQPTPAQGGGYQSWRLASKDEVQGLLKAYSGSNTVAQTLATDFPSLFANTSYVMLGEPVPFPEANSSNCYMNFLVVNATLDAAFDCGTLTAPRPYDVHIYAETAYGPYQASFCETSMGFPCTRGMPRWTLASDMSRPGPQAMMTPPWPITDSSGCPSGQTGTNPAGWLKPCGNDWVNEKYQDVLPNAQTQAALKLASAAALHYLR